MNIKDWKHIIIYVFCFQDVLDSLQAKLGLKAMSHFSLVVEHVKSLKRNKLTLLNPCDTLAKVGAILILHRNVLYWVWIMSWVYFDDLWAVVNPEIPGCSVERFRHSAGSSGLSHIYALVRSDVDSVERWNLVLYAFMYLLFSFPDLLSALLAENIFYRAYTFSYKLMDWCWHQC